MFISPFYVNTTTCTRTKITFGLVVLLLYLIFRLTSMSCRSELSCKTVEQYTCSFLTLFIRIRYDNDVTDLFMIMKPIRVFKFERRIDYRFTKRWCEKGLVYEYVHGLVCEIT